MSDFKEFQGKNLDEAIETACDFFNLNRERLEIEIIGGGSTGIFGIMGKKKAKVKARPRVAVQEQQEANGNVVVEEDPSNDANGNVMPEEEKNVYDEIQPEMPSYDPLAAAQEPASKPKKRKPRKRSPKKEARGENQQRREKPRDEHPRDEKPARKEEPQVDIMADLDKDELIRVSEEVTTKLLSAIVEGSDIKVSMGEDRVLVVIDDEENSGLIIGREGQTLSALQYLVNRLVSRKMESSVRIQIDTGDYRRRQDEKLQDIAHHLADKASDLGRTQSTKPLSSYHRRVVHLALQDHDTVYTRSKGEGPMKRVLIVPKRRNNRSRQRY